jgi:UDP-2,4-diacetamido-2,4,6-trideoxy-beta-L-altropyranose hydrolase
MMAGTILIRADASVEIGTGHVMRCLALAQAWQDAGGSAVFAMAEATAAIREKLAAEKIEVREISSPVGSLADATGTTELGRACGADWIVLDGYRLDADYQRRIKESDAKLLWIDDNGHAEHYFADLAVNQNLHARESLYRNREAACRLLLGPRYAMLRREFSAWRDWKRDVRVCGARVLVTLGGSDPGNATVAVVEALRLVGVEYLDVVVVIGGSNPHAESIARAAEGLAGTVRLLRNAANMPELMAWADVAISAAGATCWEMCLLGLPAVVIDAAENQRNIAEQLARLGIAVHAGSADSNSAEELAEQIKKLLLSAECRDAMSRRGRELVDGIGAERVVGEMLRRTQAEPGQAE